MHIITAGAATHVTDAMQFQIQKQPATALEVAIVQQLYVHHKARVVFKLHAIAPVRIPGAAPAQALRRAFVTMFPAVPSVVEQAIAIEQQTVA